VQPHPSASAARAQLERLVSSDRARGALEPFARLPPLVDARPAAVLILFGVLDAVPSDASDSPEVSRDLDVLLLARATTLRAHPGQIAFPGGRLDPGDDGPAAAALREAREETGLDPAGVDVLGTLGSVPLAFSRYQVTPVLAWWRQPSPVGVVDAAESSSVFRAPVADLLDPAHRGSTVLRRDGEELRGPAFRVAHDAGTHTVWGFTAMVLDGLFDLLGWTRPWDRDRVIPLPLPPDAPRRWD
jgi:8-oxo-dGTP pyrophosphatase MutT (NUDIX family)